MDFKNTRLENTPDGAVSASFCEDISPDLCYKNVGRESHGNIQIRNPSLGAQMMHSNYEGVEHLLMRILHDKQIRQLKLFENALWQV